MQNQTWYNNQVHGCCNIAVQSFYFIIPWQHVLSCMYERRVHTSWTFVHQATNSLFQHAWTSLSTTLFKLASSTMLNHVQAGQPNHVQAGQLNHVQAGQLNHVQAGQLDHVQACKQHCSSWSAQPCSSWPAHKCWSWPAQPCPSLSTGKNKLCVFTCVHCISYPQQKKQRTKSGRVFYNRSPLCLQKRGKRSLSTTSMTSVTSRVGLNSTKTMERLKRKLLEQVSLSVHIRLSWPTTSKACEQLCVCLSRA